MDIKDQLKQLGFHSNQVAIYLALLQLGEATIQEISNKSKIKRTTTYSILDSLVNKGTVTYIEKGGHRTYYAENPKKVLSFLKVKEMELRSQQTRFSEILPELLSIYNVKATKPKIRFYEGVEGIKQIFEETLLLKRGEEMLAYSSAAMIHQYLSDEWVREYLANRVKCKIYQRAIAEDSLTAQEHQKNDKCENRQTILVPKEKFPFSNEINIFGNKIAIVSYKDLMGVVIESVDVANTQKAIFELAWIGAGHLTSGKKTVRINY
jgi:sugar-specific transcriptional regulator TrmB